MKYFFIVALLFCSADLFSQCATTISSFPYAEDFEITQGNWTSGGANNDWAWGAPSKAIINTAGSGSKCWITGTLTTSFYNYGERSWVQSPCFDFTSLAHPYISFTVYWETEHHYDGANFQYSLNNGTTWINVGSYYDSVNCNNANWFNYASVNNLATLATVKEGWTGTTLPTSGSCQGGNGSNGWVIAKHCMNNLAGQPSVIFRFTFGSGTTCNNYDGFALDNILIEESPVVVPTFTHTCISSDKVNFAGQVGTCADHWLWNFNDAGSGSNTSTLQNPNHTFSQPGTYSVSLTASNSCGSSASVAHTVNIISASATATNVKCFGGNNGTATINITGSGSPFTYSWNTNPVQTGITATNLSQGTYTFIVTGNNVCADTGTVVISQPSQINHNIAIVNAHCGFNNGAASIAVNGGTPPYHYTWSTGAVNVVSVSNLAAGNYSVTVTDSNQCSVSNNFTIIQPQALSVLANAQLATCGNANGSVILNVNGGTQPYSYSWTPQVSNGNVANNLSGGNYFATVTDSNGCTKKDSATVIQQSGVLLNATITPDTCNKSLGTVTVNTTSGTAPFIYLWNPGGNTSNFLTNILSGEYSISVTDANGCNMTQQILVDDYGSFSINLGKDTTICISSEIIFSPGNFSSYQWQDGSQLSYYTTNVPGKFWVNVTNSLGCSSSDTIVVKEKCTDDLWIPNSFSPNNDSRNDLFFTSGLNVTSFSMEIFNRWGQKFFESNDIASSWNGTYNGSKAESGVYIYLIKFSIDYGVVKQKVGHVLLIR